MAVTEQQLFDLLVNERWGMERLHYFLSREHPEVLTELQEVCPLCHKGPLKTLGRKHRVEVVCTSCGVVVQEVYKPADYLPFDTTYAHTANIAHGKSLGTPTSQNLLQQIVVKSPQQYGLTKDDIEFVRRVLEAINNGEPVTRSDVMEFLKRYLHKIEVTHIKTQVQNVEPTQSIRLKTEVAGLLDAYGLYTGATYNEFHHMLADRAGEMASLLGRFMEAGVSSPPNSYRKLATAVILTILEPTSTCKELYERILDSEDLNPSDIKMLQCLSHCRLLGEQARVFQSCNAPE